MTSDKQFAKEYLEELNKLTNMNFEFRRGSNYIGIKDWQKTHNIELRSKNYDDLADSIKFVIDIIDKTQKGLIESIYGGKDQ